MKISGNIQNISARKRIEPSFGSITKFTINAKKFDSFLNNGYKPNAKYFVSPIEYLQEVYKSNKMYAWAIQNL